MTWPSTTGNINTTNLDSGTDSPAAARADIKSALDEIKNIINGRSQASGVAGLDSNIKVIGTQLPDEINSSAAADLVLDPSTGRVKIEEVLWIQPQTRAQLYARTDLVDGLVAMASDGDSTMDTPVYYAGGAWRYFSNNTQVSST